MEKEVKKEKKTKAVKTKEEKKSIVRRKVKKQEKLKQENIKRNSSNEIGHTIIKIRKHERLMMFLTTVIFIVLIVIVSYSVFFVIETKNAFDVFRDGRLEVEYKELLTGVGDIVTLNESNINNHDNFKTRYSFKVSNGSKDKIKYRVVLEIDDEMIEMDDCKNNIINNDAIMYSIAGSDDKALNVLDDSNEFILKEGIIDGRTSIESDLDIWIDKDKIVDITKNHFHGKIRVEDIDK